MSDKMVEERVEHHVGLDHQGAFEITTAGESVTGKHLFADGGDGQEKEVNVLDPLTGASSAAPENSGIPSAITQQRISSGGVKDKSSDDQDVTPMQNRDIPVRQKFTP